MLAAGLSFNVPLMTVVAAESARPQERSRVIATVVAFGDLANSAAAFGLGLVADGVGYRGMYLVVMVVTLCATVLYRSPFTEPVTAIRARPSGGSVRAMPPAIDPSTVRAVVFDIGGVFLIPHHERIRPALAEAGIDVPPDEDAFHRAHHVAVHAISEASGR